MSFLKFSVESDKDGKEAKCFVWCRILRNTLVLVWTTCASYDGLDLSELLMGGAVAHYLLRVEVVGTT